MHTLILTKTQTHKFAQRNVWKEAENKSVCPTDEGFFPLTRIIFPCDVKKNTP